MMRNKTIVILFEICMRCCMNFIVGGCSVDVQKNQAGCRNHRCALDCYVRFRPEVREILREDKRSFSARVLTLG